MTTTQQKQTQPEFPLCRCAKCGGIFRDPYEIFPGPTNCPSCHQGELAAAKAAAKQQKKHPRYWR